MFPLFDKFVKNLSPGIIKSDRLAPVGSSFQIFCSCFFLFQRSSVPATAARSIRKRRKRSGKRFISVSGIGTHPGRFSPDIPERTGSSVIPVSFLLTGFSAFL